MTKTMNIVKAVVLLAIAAFIALIVGGVFTALDAAPSYTLATSVPAEAAEGASASDAPMLGTTRGGRQTEATANADGSASESVDLPTSPLPDNGGTTDAAGKPNTASPTTQSSSPAGSQGSSPSASPAAPAPSNPPTAPMPQKTYHPAWDEWVKEGHWETVTTPATYGQREVYGSSCNECGANISGRATKHLKETHHSGYHEGIIGYETYQIAPEKSEQVWVDTSHWVYHEAYWD